MNMDRFQAIRDLYEAILQSWNQQDAAGMAAHFVERGSMVGFDGSQVNSLYARTKIHGRLSFFIAHQLPGTAVLLIETP